MRKWRILSPGGVGAGATIRLLSDWYARVSFDNQMLTELFNAFILIGICVVIHSTGIVVAGVAMVRRREAIARRAGAVNFSLVLIAVFASLMLLHLAENAVWAAVYYWRGLFHNYETAMYFSLATYTGIGYGDVVLPEKWRLLGALEGISGVLLIGLSTAFLFSVMNALFQFRVQRMNLKTDSPGTPRNSEPTPV